MWHKVLMLIAALSWDSGQATYSVNVTGAISKERIHEPSSTFEGIAPVTGGSPGVSRRRDDLTFKILSVVNANGVGAPVVDALLINSGKESIDIPVHASPSDVEPLPFSTPYSFKSAVIYLFRSETGSPFGSLTLYGSSTVEGSLKTLRPGQSVEIRGSISEGPNNRGPMSDNEKQIHLKATFWIDDDVVTRQGEEIHQSSQQKFPPVQSANEIVIPSTR